MIYDLPDSMPGRFLCILVVAAMFMGAVRIVKRTRLIEYPLFCLFLGLTLSLWNFSPTVRLMLPIFPLLAIGLYLEGGVLAALIRRSLRGKDFGNRATAYVILVALFCGCAYGIRKNMIFIVREIPAMLQQGRELTARSQEVFRWCRVSLPSSAVVLASDDTLVYLYTGRKSVRPVPNSIAFYTNDRAGMLENFTHLDEVSRAFGITHILINLDDYATEFELRRSPTDPAAVAQRSATQDRLRRGRLHSTGDRANERFGRGWPMTGSTRITRTIAGALSFALLLVPSAWFAWQNRHMPQFGQAHDDAIYYIASKSLADGQGYRISSLPRTPYETKYPPLLPWLLSIAWMVQPKFPENLAVATAIQWAIIPPFLWLCAIWFRRMGLSSPYRWFAVAILAIQPYTVMFGAGIFTEALYTAFLLGSLIACDRARHHIDGWRWAAFAGALAGFGYLARTAGVVAIVAGPIAFLACKKRREALAFFLGMIPMVVGWMVWARIHQSSATDFVSLYNTNYLGFQLANVHWKDLAGVAWINLAHMLYEMGALVFPMESDSFFMQLVRDAIAIAILWRLFCRRRDPALQPYLWFAAISVVEMLVWHFPPNLRLMYPLIPLFVVGLIWEGQHLAEMIRGSLRHRDRSQRVAAWIIGGVAAAAGFFGLWTQVQMNFRELPEISRNNQAILEERAQAYRWIGQHVDPKLNVMALNPALYLYTGRQTASVGIMPIDWYHHDRARMLAPFQRISAFASENDLDYIYMHDSDYSALLPDAPDDARKIVESHARLQRVFRSGHSSIFKVTRSETDPTVSSAAR